MARRRTTHLAVAFALAAAVCAACAAPGGGPLVAGDQFGAANHAPASNSSTNINTNTDTSAGGAGGAAEGAPAALGATVIAVHPRNPAAYTQGLERAAAGQLYDSSGLYGQSWLAVTNIADGAATVRVDVDAGWFAEGITVVGRGTDGPELVALTWRENVATFRDPTTLAERRRVPYDREGWGACALPAHPHGDERQAGSGEVVATSDGSATLTFHDPTTLAPLRTVTVTAPDADGEPRPVGRLNELECADGLIWANIWQQNTIVAIDPADGRVVGTLDARALAAPLQAAGGEELNGIASTGKPCELYLTGKRWQALYLVQVHGGICSHP